MVVALCLASACTLDTAPLRADAGGTADTNADWCPRLALWMGGARRIHAYQLDTTRNDIVLCRAGDDEMVRVGDFWIDRYESSIWASDDCTGTEYGGASDDFPATFPDNAKWTAPLYACSVTGVPPTRFVTYFQAQQACAISGKHLCSNAEWQAAVAGTNDPGVFDGSTSNACVTMASGPRATGGGDGDPASSSSCVSRWGAEDMIGDLQEATSDWSTEPGDNGAHDAFGNEFGDDVYAHGGARADPGLNNDLSHDVWVTNAPNEVFGRLPAEMDRGGDYESGTSAGAFDFNPTGSPTGTFDNVGFRCCATR
jgi:hypothetical protein